MRQKVTPPHTGFARLQGPPLPHLSLTGTRQPRKWVVDGTDKNYFVAQKKGAAP